MTTRQSRFTRMIRPMLAATIASWILAGTSEGISAQDDPFGGAAAPKTTVDAAAAKPGKTASLSIPDDPAAQAILSSAPSSPEQFARAVRNLLDLGYPEHALVFLEGLEKSNPSPQDWAALQANFGTDFFLRVAREPALQPVGGRLSRVALGAARKLADDPDRIRQLIGQLGSNDAAQRRSAVLALKQVGVPAIPPLILVLADEASTGRHRRVQGALAELGELAIEPLIGALESPEPAFRGRVVEVLGVLKARRAIGYLVRPGQVDAADAELQVVARDALFQIVEATPDRRDAVHYLRRRISDLLAGTSPVLLDAENQGQLWHWDAERRTTFARRYAQRQLCAVEAARLAAELFALEPDSIDNRRIYLAADLEAAKVVSGLDKPLPRGDGSAMSRALVMGGEVVEDLLAEMLRRDRPTAAACAAEVLGETGNVEVVQGTSGVPRPLVLALNHADRRLRFAALQAIVKLNPTEPFAGSNYVGESLGFLAASVGSRRALVAHHRLDEARTLAGILNQMGYEADTATSSRGVFVQASRQPDYEFVLLSDTLGGPSVKELLPQLRQDKRTAGLAVGVLVNLASTGEVPVAATKGTEASPEELSREAKNEARSRDVGDGESKPVRSFQGTEAPKQATSFAVEAIRRGSEYFDRTPTPVDPMIRVRQWTIGDDRTDAFPRPYDLDGMDNVVTRLRASAGRLTLSRDERVAQADFALACIAKFAGDEARYGFYEVFRYESAAQSALRTPELMPSAARALGTLGTPKAQVALVDLASQHGRTAEDRRIAAEAFREAVRRRSLRLTRTEIVRQYTRYNQSEHQDQDTQAILGTVLDAIESVDAAAKNEHSNSTTPAAETSASPTHAPTP